MSALQQMLLGNSAAGGIRAIFGYGANSTIDVSMTNLVSNTGVVSSDVTGVGTDRRGPSAAGYGTDKAIFGYGYSSGSSTYNMTNLVSNTGVVSSDVTGVGQSRGYSSAAGYGTDKAIFGYGIAAVFSSFYSMTNLVSNTGVVGNDVTGVGTARWQAAAARYGTDKAIFGYGTTTTGASTSVSVTNLVSNTGVVSSDTTGVGTARFALGAAGYDGDKAIFGYGVDVNGVIVSLTNLVSNTGVVSTDTTGVGTARYQLGAASY